MAKDIFFEAFPPVSKADWLAQVTKDLKGKPLTDLDWQLSPSLRVSPLVHASDAGTHLPFQDKAQGWELCENIWVEDMVSANTQALAALNGGAEGLCLLFPKAPVWSDIEQLFAGIHLDFIGLHLEGEGIKQNPAAMFGHLIRLAQRQGVETAQLRGSVSYSPAQLVDTLVDWRYLVDLLEFTQTSFPRFKVVNIDFSRDEDPVVALSETLQAGNEYLKKLTRVGVPLERIAGAIQISVPVGSSYFLEMAKIRALKLLWLHLLKGWGAPTSYPVVFARFAPEAYTDELYTNMIRATTIAMSAVLGGADHLAVLPYDAGREHLAKYPPAFGRRIARNVQHLLKMESGLDEIPDPVAGSYYIEQLTASMAEKAWELFSKSA